MYKWVGSMLLICLFILSGCMNSTDYKDDDVAAMVRGEEITVGYLRFLYTDDAIVEMIDEAVKAKLAEQEVKKMNIDVSKQVKEIKESYGEYPQDELYSAKAQSIRAFADPQARELGIDPKEYYEKYTEVSAEIAAYINVYTSEILGELEDDEFGIEEYNHHASELLDDLVERNKDAIEVRIK
ncbi:putative S18 family serine protease [Virgibacillus halotolerans]|uniref:hypothetical protein n=1 Tax=Virgibacillus halotolerans TaxID=1071053 RepID=UPI0019600D7A|nr:hypothetical protein [Virgibacillus halotolerans]MBM7600585.1 putative S18 family serine protease [Virgibacillus halotolerans]